MKQVGKVLEISTKTVHYFAYYLYIHKVIVQTTKPLSIDLQCFNLHSIIRVLSYRQT